MAIAAVDEVMLREPRLLVPRMQPLGPVRIDNNHPLAKNIVAFCIPGRDEIVSGGKGTPLQTTALLRGVRGLAVSTPDSTSGWNWVISNRAYKKELQGKFTVIAGAELNTVTRYNSLVSIAFDTEATWNQPYQHLAVGLQYSASVTTLYVTTAGSGTIAYIAESSDGFYETGKFIVYGVTRNGLSNSPLWYKNGAYFSSSSDRTNTEEYSTEPTTFDGLTLLGKSAASIGESPIGTAEFAMIFDVPLSGAWMSSLSLDPYQIISPV